jgi:hypothetical protein
MTDEASAAGNRSFQRLKGLAGEWRGRTPHGRDIGLSYRLIAHGSALVETWDLGGGRESLTIYHMDGDVLLASHFCPLGNQPRLSLRRAAPDRLEFEFRDGTNLDPAADAHQHSFWIEFQGPVAIMRSETYREGAEDETEAVRYERAPAVDRASGGPG